LRLLLADDRCEALLEVRLNLGARLDAVQDRHVFAEQDCVEMLRRLDNLQSFIAFVRHMHCEVHTKQLTELFQPFK
jgi:hypothetical protein